MRFNKIANFALVRKSFAITLLSIYLICITELIQLVKLPALIEHYTEHKEKNNGLSLFDFLVIHYAQPNDNDGDEDKEMKLPFKSHDGCINTSVVAFISNDATNFTTKPIYSESKIYLIYSEKSLIPSYLSAIWQPPKSC